MTIDKRQGAVFASGVLLGAAAVAGALKRRGPALAPQSEPKKPEASAAPAGVDQPNTRLQSSPIPPPPPPPPRKAVPSQTIPPRAVGDASGVVPRQPLPERVTAAASAMPAVPPPRTASRARPFKLFVAGGVLTACLGAAWLLPDFLGLPIPGKTALTPSALPQASGQVVTCPLEPASAVSGSQDGQFPFQPGVPGLTAADMATFLVIGSSAAVAGRPRDAEVAFLMSCRLADKLRGASSIESADGKLMLGAHYARLATGPDAPGGAADAARPELLRRAEFLYLDSLRIYTAAYGPADEKSRVAADGLAAVRQTLAGSAQPVPAPALQHAGAPPSPAASIAEPVQAAASPPARAAPPSPVVARAAPARAEPPDAAQPQAKSPGMRADASFDCSRARSMSEKMICSDAELFQLNHEVGRVYARARDASPDRADFGRRNELEARRRESICRDRGCLLRWYAYRRDQLLREVQGRSQPGPAGWR